MTLPDLLLVAWACFAVVAIAGGVRFIAAGFNVGRGSTHADAEVYQLHRDLLRDEDDGEWREAA